MQQVYNISPRDKNPCKSHICFKSDNVRKLYIIFAREERHRPNGLRTRFSCKNNIEFSYIIPYIQHYTATPMWGNEQYTFDQPQAWVTRFKWASCCWISAPILWSQTDRTTITQNTARVSLASGQWIWSLIVRVAVPQRLEVTTVSLRPGNIEHSSKLSYL